MTQKKSTSLGFFDYLASHYRVPPYKREYRFHPPRRWRFDIAFPEKKLAVEFEGGVFTGGRHVRPGGYIGDCDKYNQAAEDGWIVLRYTIKHLQADPRGVIEQIKRVHEGNHDDP